MAFFRYGYHPWILIPTWCPPCIFTNFWWAKSHKFFIKQKSKFTEIINICWKYVPFILCRSSQFDQMFYISVNFYFCIMKKLWDLAHEKLVNILGGHHVGTNIHGCQPYLKIAIYVLKSAVKRRTIMQATVCIKCLKKLKTKNWKCFFQFFLENPTKLGIALKKPHYQGNGYIHLANFDVLAN